MTLDPAGMHCPARDDAFVSSVVLVPDAPVVVVVVVVRIAVYKTTARRPLLR